jgi:hypothetical protein
MAAQKARRSPRRDPMKWTQDTYFIWITNHSTRDISRGFCLLKEDLNHQPHCLTA